MLSTKETQYLKIWKVYSTVKEMLSDRNYTDYITGKIVHSFDEFISTHVKFSLTEDTDDIPTSFDKTNMNFICMNKMTNNLIMVHFSNDESIGIGHITKIHEKMVATKLSHCILIYPKTLTSSAKKYLDKIKSKVYIETFCEDDLIINITKHHMMPKYVPLSNADKQKFYKASNITDSQLPRILLNDPVSRYYGLKRGDVVRIIRKSETAGLNVTYRICN